MPSFKKLVLLLFAASVMASTTLLLIYLQELNKGCVVEIKSDSQNISLRVSEKEKWQNFITSLGNCKNGSFTVYVASGEKEASLARRIELVISDEKQIHRVSNSVKEILYTYNLTFKENEKLASIILNFPNNTKKDKKMIYNAIFLTSYSLFKGKSYEPVGNLTQFNSLSSLGLLYENQ